MSNQINATIKSIFLIHDKKLLLKQWRVFLWLCLVSLLLFVCLFVFVCFICIAYNTYTYNTYNNVQPEIIYFTCVTVNLDLLFSFKMEKKRLRKILYHSDFKTWFIKFCFVSGCLRGERLFESSLKQKRLNKNGRPFT